MGFQTSGAPWDGRRSAYRIEDDHTPHRDCAEGRRGPALRVAQTSARVHDVMNKQREAVYGLRRRLLEGTDQKDLILEDYVAAILAEQLEEYCPPKAHADDWNIKGLKDAIFTRFGVDFIA